MKHYGVIMAGGGGTRFWPLSRQAMPKQMLNLSGKDRMINETIDRLDGVIEKSDMFIVTNEKQAGKMLECVDGRIAKTTFWQSRLQEIRQHALDMPLWRSSKNMVMASCVSFRQIIL